MAKEFPAVEEPGALKDKWLTAAAFTLTSRWRSGSVPRIGNGDGLRAGRVQGGTGGEGAGITNNEGVVKRQTGGASEPVKWTVPV